MMQNGRRKTLVTGLKLFPVGTFIALCVSLNMGPVQSDPPEISHDGINLEKGTGCFIIDSDPEADFSI